MIIRNFSHLTALGILSDIEREVDKMLKLLKKNNLIATEVYNQLKPIGTRIPYLYGLPKIHKQGTPLRPILSMFNSPHHKLAKWLVNILEPVKKEFCRFTLKDSFELADQLEDMNVKDKYMFSFDVTSLFTNVPLHETIDIICHYVSIHNHAFPIPSDILKQLLLLCTYNIQFTFNGKPYRQIDGVAMGSPLGPLLADVFMASIEERLEQKINKLPLYRRYVDDILLICDDQTEADSLLAEFNSLHSNLRLTSEQESDNSISFLDILITRKEDGFIKRSVYRKSTWTGQYLNFYSFCPIRYKRGLVRTLFIRAKKICTSDCLDVELDKITNILLENGYPIKFIKKYLNDPKPKANIYTASKKPVYIKLPFKGDSFSFQINKKLRCTIEKVYNTAKLVLIEPTTPLRIKRHSDSKDDYVTSHCVYDFKCSCGCNYIGRTDRSLRTRAAEHIPKWLVEAMNTSGFPENSKDRRPASSIAKHLIESGHRVEPDKAFSLLYKNSKGRLLRFIEALAIKKFDPILCVQKQFILTLQLPW